MLPFRVHTGVAAPLDHPNVDTDQIIPKQFLKRVRRAREVEGYRLTVDLERCEVRDGQGFKAAFEIDEFRRQCLLEGLDDVGLTLRHESLIRHFEERRAGWMGVSTTESR